MLVELDDVIKFIMELSEYLYVSDIPYLLTLDIEEHFKEKEGDKND